MVGGTTTQLGGVVVGTTTQLGGRATAARRGMDMTQTVNHRHQRMRGVTRRGRGRKDGRVQMTWTALEMPLGK